MEAAAQKCAAAFFETSFPGLNFLFLVIILEERENLEKDKGDDSMERLKKEKTLAVTAFFLGVLCLLAVLAALGRKEASGEEVFQVFEAANFSRIECRISRVGGRDYLEFEGCFPGELSREEQKLLAEILLERMGAKQVAGVDEDTLYTVYAYAKGAGETRSLPEECQPEFGGDL